jgi:hypothetical protein
MPYGDIGGSCSQLIITCLAECDIAKGDPVTHLGNYSVRNYLGDLFGVALENAKAGQSVPVTIKGIVSIKNFEPDITGIGSWRISQNGPKLVPLLMGSRLNVLFVNEDRMDVLL